MSPCFTSESTTEYNEPKFSLTDSSLRRSRRVIDISYGCIGRSQRSASTARASGFVRLRGAMTLLEDSGSNVRSRIYLDYYASGKQNGPRPGDTGRSAERCRSVDA